MRARRWVLAGIAAALGVVTLLLLALIMPAAEQQAIATGCADGLVVPPAQAVSQPVSGGQLAQVRTIIGVGKARNVPAKGWVIALAVGLQESGLRNLANPVYPESLALPHEGTGTNYDSLGLFQQRPLAGWGTPAQLMDPVYEAMAFYGGADVPPANEGLLDVPNWQSLPVTVAAQTVQGSAVPTAYAKWEDEATRLAADNSDAPPINVGGNAAAGTGAVTAVSATADCATTQNVSSAAAGGTAGAVIAQAERWFGTPYAWGGGTMTGPSLGFAQGAGTVGFDCSSYTRIAFFQGAGLTLPRTAAAQYAATAGRTVVVGTPDLAQLQPGDLLFWGSSVTTIHHVALYVGNGRMDQEAHTGTVASSDPVYDSDFFAATRPLG